MIDGLLAALAIVLIIVGIVGCVLPIVPGPPISFAAMLVAQFTRFVHFETSTIIILGLLALIVQVLDYIVPAWGTKKFGGTKYGSWGSIIGLIIGLFFLPPLGPFGIITILAGPFFGALIGEKIGGANNEKSMKAAIGSFIGFLTGTFMKLVLSIVITGFIIFNFVKTSF